MASKKADRSEFLKLALERFKLAAEAEDDIRTRALEDLKFFDGQQWDEAIKTVRKRRGKPCLVMNHLPQFKRMICNEYRQSKPGIIINPIGDESDVDTAEIWQGIIRHVEVNSNADVPRDVSFEQMVISSFGYRRVITEYDESGELEIKIKAIKNQFTVYFDPLCMEQDYSDARYAFIIEDVPRKLFEDEYRDSEAVSLDEYQSVGDGTPDWLTEKHIRVAEYFYVEEDKQQKGSAKRKVKWAKITAQDVLEEQDWGGKYIPIIPVLGEEMIIDGKRILKGFVRDAKDAQRQYNFMHSGAAHAIALNPKSPYLLAVGQAEGLESKWEKANIEDSPYLEYNAKDVNGTEVGPPQRANNEVQIQGYKDLILMADNDLKAAIGIYDASLGQRGPEQSGKAIAQRKQQGDIATLNYSDNGARSMLFEGRVLLDLGRVVYDTPRVMRIIKPDDSVEHVITHNGPGQADAAKQMLTEKIKKIFDIGAGRYDVAVSVGPSYQSKRQEAVATQLELVKASPKLMDIGGDIIIRNMDIPQAGELADRVKKTLPPQLQDDNSTDPKVQLQNAQGQLAQMAQQHQMMQEVIQKQTKVIDEKQIEAQNKIDIVRLQEETKITVAEINTKAQESLARIKLETDMFGKLHVSAHDAGTQASQQAHDRQMAASQQAHDSTTQAVDQSHESQMSDKSAAQQSALASQQAAQQPEMADA